MSEVLPRTNRNNKRRKRKKKTQKQHQKLIESIDCVGCVNDERHIVQLQRRTIELEQQLQSLLNENMKLKDERRQQTIMLQQTLDELTKLLSRQREVLLQQQNLLDDERKKVVAETEQQHRAKEIHHYEERQKELEKIMNSLNENLEHQKKSQEMNETDGFHINLNTTGSKQNESKSN
jgi:chromosome segregation ATPase